ncbi:hypothetical protein B7463_g11358, partial [Scytalidium lignicola]
MRTCEREALSMLILWEIIWKKGRDRPQLKLLCVKANDIISDVLHRHTKSHVKTGCTWVNYVKINDSIARHDPSLSSLEGTTQALNDADLSYEYSEAGHGVGNTISGGSRSKDRGRTPPSSISQDASASLQSLSGLTPEASLIEDGDFISRLTPFPLALDPDFYQFTPNQERGRSLLTEEQTVPFALQPTSSANRQSQRARNPLTTEPTNDATNIRNVTSIPFSRTKQCWISQQVCQRRTGIQLRERVVGSKRMNLLCDRDVDNYILEGRAKRLKFHETSRQRLEAILESNARILLPPSESSTQLIVESTGPSNTFSQLFRGDIPATTLLDIALDVYIGHCNGKLPIIHSATFITEAASPSFLLAALLSGFLMFRAKGAPEYVIRMFPVLVSMTLTELQSSTNEQDQPIKYLNAMTTALLNLHLGVLLGKLGMDTQLDVLTVTLFTTAEDHGLFGATDDVLPQDFFSDTTPLEVQWARWARVEPVKRDHVNFGTAVGAFRAAIVLGLYYLTVPPNLHAKKEHSLDLLSNPDWEEIGRAGFPILGGSLKLHLILRERDARCPVCGGPYSYNASSSGSPNNDTFACAMKGMSDAMTKKLRGSVITANGANATNIAVGKTLVVTTFIHIEWLWIVLPTMAWVFSLVTWLGTALRTYQWRIPKWRDNPLPLMFLYRENSGDTFVDLEEDSIDNSS